MKKKDWTTKKTAMLAIEENKAPVRMKREGHRTPYSLEVTPGSDVDKALRGTDYDPGDGQPIILRTHWGFANIIAVAKAIKEWREGK